MARPESRALGGFYATHPELFDPISTLVRVVYSSEDDTLLVADPCAGAGVAVRELTRRWVVGAGGADLWSTDAVGDPCDGDEVARLKRERWNDHAKIFACELEATRAHQLKLELHHVRYSCSVNEVAQGDAFLLSNAPDEGVHILWHNPPYDTDPDVKRLEERWLQRFLPLVVVGGAVLHFVPFYSLVDSAETIACNLEEVHCFRIPEPHFSTYKQAVLVGRRRRRLASPDPKVLARARAWGASAAAIPELPAAGVARPLVVVTTSPEPKEPSWKVGQIDLVGLLAQYEPWTLTDRAGRRSAVPNIEPSEPYTHLMAPRLRLACPPRPAHIAMAAGAGVLSGARLTPDAGQNGPPLLLKGVHRRTFRHLRWKEQKGERVAEERQHHPELQLSILNIAEGRYRTLESSMDPSGHEDVGRWTVGDLIARYSGSMLEAMRARCDLLYEPRRPGDKDRYLWPVSPDPLLGGQEDGVRALLRLLREPDRSAVLLGEIGVGKTRMALTAACYHLGGRGRVFVMCPTAIIPEWEREVAKVLPKARVVVLEDSDAIDAEAEHTLTANCPACERSREAGLASSCAGMTICLMSKEPAKLGHSWVGAPICPRCGTASKESAERLAETRARCPAVVRHAANAPARIVHRLMPLAAKLADPQLHAVVRRDGGRVLQRAVDRGVVAEPGAWKSIAYVVRGVVPALRRYLARTTDWNLRGTVEEALFHVLNALGDDALIVREARRAFRSTLIERDGYGAEKDMRATAARMLLLLPPWSPWIEVIAQEMRSYRDRKGHRFADVGAVLRTNQRRRRGEKVIPRTNDEWITRDFGQQGDEPTYKNHVRGSDDALRVAIEILTGLAAWTEEECGEPLFQAEPRPRRAPLAQYILRRHPKLFHFMVIDESHKYANKDSAQSRAAQRLLSLRMRQRIPVIALTGSVMNGYARSLFVLLWHLSSAFRREFAFDQAGEFERRYGFLVQVVEKVDEKKQRVAFGSVSDRVTTRARTTGAAPGILPTALLRFLLPISVTVQLSDLEQALPPCREEVVYAKPTKEQREAADAMQSKLLTKMAGDRFKGGLAGRLFGALGHLPRYYDHATSDVGNGEDGAWTIAYPDGADVAPDERVIHVQAGLDPKTVLPKEAKLLERVRGALARGRNVVVASTRTELAQRLARLVRAAVEVPVALLDAKKVSARARRGWVEKVCSEGTRVLVCNPAALPEGLNVLVGYFSTVCIFDDPNNDPTLLRQFRGRFVRIGQTDEVEFLVFAYEGTLQDDANDLLQKKRVVAEATDGIDASAAFEVAGVGEQAAFESDLGKALYARLTA